MKPFHEVLMVGTAAGLTGGIVGLAISKTAIGEGYEFFPIYAAVAAILTGISAEWILMGRAKSYSIKRGGLAGGITGIFSHYLCWYLIIVVRNICYAVWNSCTDTLGYPPVDPLEGLLGAAGLTIASLVLLGWITFPLGAIVGGIFGFWFQRRVKF